MDSGPAQPIERRQIPFLNFADPDLVDKLILLAVEGHQLGELARFCETLTERLGPTAEDEAKRVALGKKVRADASAAGRTIPRDTVGKRKT